MPANRQTGAGIPCLIVGDRLTWRPRSHSGIDREGGNMENAIASGDARGFPMEPGQATVPWALAWFTWPSLFVANIGVGLHAIAQHWNYSMVLTSLLLADVA